MWVAYNTTGGETTIKEWTTANAAGVSATNTGASSNHAIGFLTHDFANGHGYVATSGTAMTGHSVCLLDFSTTTAVATDAEITNIGDLLALQVGGYRSAGGVNNVWWSEFDTVSIPDLTNYGAYTTIQASNGTAIGPVLRGAGLASRVFKIGSYWYALAAYQSDTHTNMSPSGQRRLFLLEVKENSTGPDGNGAEGDMNIAGMILSNDASGFPAANSCLPSVYVSGSAAKVAAVRALNVESEGATASTLHFALSSIALNFSGSGLGAPVVFNDLLHVPCAAHKTFDGKDVVEAGFYVDPEPPLLDPSGDFGEMESGTYQYCLTFSRVDSRGRLHRSAPGGISTVTIDDAVDTQVEVRALHLRATDSDPWFNLNPGVTPARVEIWRTTKDADIFYLLTSYDNEASFDFALNAFIDTKADADIENNEILYTISEELDNQKPPAVKVIHTWQQRAFCLTGDGSTWHSKESAEGFGAEWSDEFRILSIEEGGRFVTLGSVDTSLVFFKRKRAFYTAGTGPDDKGAGPRFPPPQPLEQDLGVVNATGAVAVPGGIMCETATGRFLLNRGLTFEPVEGTESESVTIVGGVGLDSRSMTAFVTNGAILVRDWQLSQWFTWRKTSNGLAGVAICRWRNQLCVFQADGTVLREIPGQYFDGTSTAIAAIIEFAYLRLENARIYQLRIVGEVMASFTLTETVTYNGNPATAASKSKAVTAAGDVEDLNVIPNTGRMSSIKVKLEWTSTTEGLRFSQVGLEVVGKPGLKKSASSRNLS